MKSLSIILFAVLILFSKNSKSQELISTGQRLIEVKEHYGYLLAHRKGMASLVNSHMPGFEVAYLTRSIPDSTWNSIYNNPLYGVSYYFIDLKNPEQLGFATGIYPFFNFLIKRTKKMEVNYRLGMGVGYCSKTFDRLENYKNTVIGSNVNGMMVTSLNLMYQVTDKVFLQGELALHHFSNGAFKVPNLGYNLPSASFGVSYALRKVDIPLKIKEGNIEKRFSTLDIFLSGGIKEIYPIGQQKYGILNIKAEWSQPVSTIFNLGVMIDIFYNSSVRKRLELDGDTTSTLGSIQQGIMLNYQCNLTSKVRVIAGMGAYVFSKYKGDTNFYHRLGIKYTLTDDIILMNSLTTNFFKANFFEWGIGYRIKH